LSRLLASLQMKGYPKCMQRINAALRFTVGLYRIRHETKDGKIAIPTGRRYQRASARKLPRCVESEPGALSAGMEFVQLRGRQCGADIDRIEACGRGRRTCGRAGKRPRHETIQ